MFRKIGEAMRPKPVQLPREYEDRNLIKYMEDGDTAWTLPWAVMVDEDMHVWINGDYPAERQPGGTVQMLIRKEGDGIHILSGMAPQRPIKGTPWVGSTEDDLLPVTHIN